MRNELEVNPEILTWAITRAGHNLDNFLIENKQVDSWIKNEKNPTVKQIEAFAKKVHLPFGYVFLENPPVETLPIPFFRSNNDGTTDTVSINVYDTILLIQQRQDWLRDYLSENNFEPLSFVGKYRDSQNVFEIVRDIRSVLNLREDWAHSCKNWEEALNHLVSVIEDRGIITVFNGVVANNTHRPIEVDECRGFVLVDEIAPFMFVNNADGKAAQMFTIVHELAHIWTGRSAGFDFRKLLPADDPIEKLCDQIAAEFLVPENAFNRAWAANSSIRALSRLFKVSEIVIARRALDTGKISKTQFFEFYEEYKNREFEKKELQTSGGDFYATARKRISLTFASHVNQAVKSGQLLYRDAYKLTSLKGDTYEKFFATNL